MTFKSIPDDWNPTVFCELGKGFWFCEAAAFFSQAGGCKSVRVATYRPNSDLVNEPRNRFVKNLSILHAQRTECGLFTILIFIPVNVQLALLNFLLPTKSFCGREI
jgi:hypothetical protein